MLHTVHNTLDHIKCTPATRGPSNTCNKYHFIFTWMCTEHIEPCRVKCTLVTRGPINTHGNMQQNIIICSKNNCTWRASTLSCAFTCITRFSDIFAIWISNIDRSSSNSCIFVFKAWSNCFFSFSSVADLHKKIKYPLNHKLFYRTNLLNINVQLSHYKI